MCNEECSNMLNNIQHDIECLGAYEFILPCDGKYLANSDKLSTMCSDCPIIEGKIVFFFTLTF